jgi:hypothetical protein
MAVSRVLVALSVLPVVVTSNYTPELVGATVATTCSELSARRDRMQAEMERLHAETALVQAELSALCTGTVGTNQTGADLPPSESHVPAATVRERRPEHRRSQTRTIDRRWHFSTGTPPRSEPSRALVLDGRALGRAGRPDGRRRGPLHDEPELCHLPRAVRERGGRGVVRDGLPQAGT